MVAKEMAAAAAATAVAAATAAAAVASTAAAAGMIHESESPINGNHHSSLSLSSLLSSRLFWPGQVAGLRIIITIIITWDHHFFRDVTYLESDSRSAAKGKQSTMGIGSGGGPMPIL